MSNDRLLNAVTNFRGFNSTFKLSSPLEELLKLVLSKREQKVLLLRYSDNNPLSAKQVGKKMDLSMEKVRQIEMRALQKLHDQGTQSICKHGVSIKTCHRCKGKYGLREMLAGTGATLSEEEEILEDE